MKVTFFVLRLFSDPPIVSMHIGGSRISCANILYYYALNKILNSDWLNTNLTLNDVWLVGSNVRQLNIMSGQWKRHVINVIPFRTQC